MIKKELESIKYHNKETAKQLEGAQTVISDLRDKVSIGLTYFYMSCGWHGWRVRKALASHQRDPGSIPGRGHM